MIGKKFRGKLPGSEIEIVEHNGTDIPNMWRYKYLDKDGEYRYDVIEKDLLSNALRTGYFEEIPGTVEHEPAESLEDAIDEADGKKDGKFSVHDMDSDDGNHDDEINVGRLADSIMRGPSYIPHYDEDGNKIEED